MNSFDGEIKIELCDKVYPMKVNFGVMAKFRSETGKDFNAFAARAIAAWKNTAEVDYYIKAQMLAEAVPMELAAWAFYLAAKECDNHVTRAEIEDAVYREGIYETFNERQVLKRSYPMVFCQLAVFCLLGVDSNEPAEESKKKDSSHSSGTASSLN